MSLLAVRSPRTAPRASLENDGEPFLQQIPRVPNCMSFLTPHETRATMTSRHFECFSRPRTCPFLQLPTKLLQYAMSFLGYRDLAMLGAADRRLKPHSGHPDALNPESLAARGLENGEPKRVYQSDETPIIHFNNDAATLEGIFGKHTLFILPHPREIAAAQWKGVPPPPNVLQLIHLQTHEELVFPLDRMIVSCHAVELPEPALIMIDNTGEVKKVTLAYLKRCDGTLDFDQVPTLEPSLNPEGIDFDWESDEDYFTVAVEGSLVAIAYSNEITVLDMADKNFRISLPFENAHEIKFYDKKVLCTSSACCAFFSLTDPDQLCYFDVQSSPRTSFKTAAFFATKIAIAYSEEINLKRFGVQVGEVHDLATGSNSVSRLAISPDCFNNKYCKYGLNQLVGYEDCLFGASYNYSLWKGNNFYQAINLHPYINDAPIHTMSKIGDRLLSASNKRVVIDHPNNLLASRSITPKFFDEWRFGFDKIISVKPAGQYLIVISNTDRNFDGSNKRKQMIQVFDLLNTGLRKSSGS